MQSLIPFEGKESSLEQILSSEQHGDKVDALRAAFLDAEKDNFLKYQLIKGFVTVTFGFIGGVTLATGYYALQAGLVLLFPLMCIPAAFCIKEGWTAENRLYQKIKSLQENAQKELDKTYRKEINNEIIQLEKASILLWDEKYGA